MRLTSGDAVKESLPFKIYICIPKVGVRYVRDNNKVVNPFGNVIANGSIKRVEYNDHHFLETTSLEEAKQYINSEKFKTDIDDFRTNGSNQDNSNKQDSVWMNKDDMKKYDSEQLKLILSMKSFVTEEDEKAADFLDNLGEKSSNNKLEEKPELPI